jgi:N-methylhydantoinase A
VTATYLVGIDTGGTFTDTVVVSSDGRTAAGKALTTHGRLMEGVMVSLARAAEVMGIERAELLANTRILSHGTTVGLNALLTGSGAKVGLLVTEGFEATLPIARSNKVHGLSDADSTDALKWRKPSLLVPRHRILGVRERTDVVGDAVVPLDEDQARAQIAKLLELGVEAIAVALMWSPVNPAHERRIGELIAEMAPGMPVSISSTIASRLGEYERTVTAVLNAYVAPLVTSYLDSLEAAVRADGFDGLFLIMTMGGGVRQARSLREAPVHLLQSGPVGGITATKRLGELLGHDHVIATDVGGTSFDVGLVVGGALPRASKPRIDRHALAIPVIDLGSIGTGGGSVAWIDDNIGALHVGPQSAGSVPGPACYGRGGTLPTVTDAAAVLGYLDRLGGALTLDRDAAVRAVATIAERLGGSVEEAAEGILKVASAQMADLVRRSTIQRGHDPRSFVLYAYGGAAPQYVGRYSADIGAAQVVIPRLAPQFSAWGAVCSDLRVIQEAELPPRRFEGELAAFENVLDRLAEEAATELRPAAERIEGAGTTVERRVGLRFVNQIHRIDVTIGEGAIDAAACESASSTFRRLYETVIGRGSAYAGSPIEIVSVSVEARIAVPMPQAAARAAAPDPRPSRHRPAVFAGRTQQVPVFAWDSIGAGARIAGPAFVESEQTTAVVYGGQQVLVGWNGDLVMEFAAVAARQEAAIA